MPSDKEKTTRQNFSAAQRVLALGYGVVAHLTFVAAVCTMVWSLYGGLLGGFGGCEGWMRWIANLILVAQFPILHSWLLTRGGRPWLNCLAPLRLAPQLQPTTYVLVASLQLLAVFLAWSPDPTASVWWEPKGAVWWVHVTLYAIAWTLLGKSMWDAHLGIQTGYIGWLSIWRNHNRISWPPLPTSGLFRICRQPIYFSFMLTLWTGPVWTLDKIVVALVWTAYCYWGPVLKEQRLERAYGGQFRAYKDRVPYWPSVGRND